MDKDMNSLLIKISKPNKRKTIHPLVKKNYFSKNLPVSSEPVFSSFSRIHYHRVLYLKNLSEKFSIKYVSCELWSGTALHLLFLLDHIPSSNWETGDFYAELSSKLSEPTYSQSHFGKSLMTYERRKYARGLCLKECLDNLETGKVADVDLDNNEDIQDDGTLKSLQNILFKNRTKDLIDNLARFNNLYTLEKVLECSTKLDKLKSSLLEMTLYLQSLKRS